MTTYGATSYYISISSTKAGASPTSYPTGNIVLLYAEQWENPRENKDKIKQMAADNSYNNRMGKMAREVSLTNCVIFDDDGNATTNTGSLNLKLTLLDYWTSIGESAVYLIITPSVDNPDLIQPNTNRVVNVALTRSGANPQDYMKGTLTRMVCKPVGGHYSVNLTFKETKLY